MFTRSFYAIIINNKFFIKLNIAVGFYTELNRNYCN